MTSQKLKLITLVHGVDYHSNDPKPEDMTSQLSDISIDLFQGLGKLNDRQVKLHIDKIVQPVAQH